MGTLILNLFVRSLLILRVLVIGFLSHSLVSCASHPVVSAAPIAPVIPSFDFSDPQFGSDPLPVITEDLLFALTPSQQQDFDRYINKNINSSVPMHRRVFNYLDRVTREFTYQAKTYTAEQTLSSLKGNCMSLAVLTTALARYADVEVKYQLVDSDPIYYRESSVVVKGVHVRSKLYQPVLPGEVVLQNRSSLIIDYLPTQDTHFLGNITHEQFMVHYLENRVVELMNEKKFPEAYWHARKALDYDAYDADALNLIAVIFRQSGNEQKAEAIYNYGLTVTDNKFTLLKNYRSLLQRQERFQEAAEITEKMAAYEDNNPFNGLQVADEAFARGHLEEATIFYKKVIKQAPYLDYGYLGLAKVNYQKGEFLSARSMLQKAVENSFKDRDKQLYMAKLTSLEKEIRLN